MFGLYPLATYPHNSSGLISYSLLCSTGVFNETANSANLLAYRKLISSADSYSLTGQPVGLYKNYLISSDIAEYSVSAFDAWLLKYSKIDAEFAEYNLTGASADLGVLQILPAGEYNLTGNAAGLYRNLKLECFVAEYQFTGGKVFTGARLFANRGIFTVSTVNARFRKGAPGAACFEWQNGAIIDAKVKSATSSFKWKTGAC